MVRWIEKARTRKYNGRKLGRAGAEEPVIISLNNLLRYTSSWYTLWLVRFDGLCQHSQSGSFLSLKKMACGVHAREIEGSTITSVLNEGAPLCVEQRQLSQTYQNWGKRVFNKRNDYRLSLPSFPFSCPVNFSRAFYFRVFPTIWEPGTGCV